MIQKIIKGNVSIDIGKTDSRSIIPLRYKVLRPGKPLDTAIFERDALSDTYHFSAKKTLSETCIVSCVSYMSTTFENMPAYQLRGMATDEEFRGTGIGAAMTNYAEQVITAETSIRLLWCNAREEAVGFYEKQGWEVVSDKFEVEGVGPHYKMKKHLN